MTKHQNRVITAAVSKPPDLGGSMQNVNVTVAGEITTLPWKEALHLLLEVTESKLDFGDGVELSRIGPLWGIRWTGQPSAHPGTVDTADIRGVTVQMRRHARALPQALEGLLRGSHRRVSLMWGSTRRYAGMALELVVEDDELYATISV